MANGQNKRPPVVAIVLVVALVAAGVGGYFWWRSQQSAQSGALEATGAVETTEYLVASAIAGRVTTVTVGEGDAVKAGQVLAKLDDAALRLQVEQASAGVSAANAAVKQAKDTGTTADTEAAKARLAQAKAGVKLAQVQLGYATVTAPHAGIVAAVAANAGQNASPGKTLATISDTSNLFVRVFVPETRIGDVKLGQSVTVTTDSSAATYNGTVEFIASQSEFTPNNVETKEQRVKLVYEVRLRVTDTSDVLKAGMPVVVTF